MYKIFSIIYASISPNVYNALYVSLDLPDCWVFADTVTNNDVK